MLAVAVCLLLQVRCYSMCYLLHRYTICVFCCRSLQEALEKFALSVQDTPRAPGGVRAALENEWSTEGPVQIAAAAVVESLDTALCGPVVLPLHHSTLSTVATAGLLHLCFLRFGDSFLGARSQVGALALRLHLQLANDPWLVEKQQAVSVAAGMQADWLSTDLFKDQSPATSTFLWDAW